MAEAWSGEIFAARISGLLRRFAVRRCDCSPQWRELECCRFRSLCLEEPLKLEQVSPHHRPAHRGVRTLPPWARCDAQRAHIRRLSDLWPLCLDSSLSQIGAGVHVKGRGNSNPGICHIRKKSVDLLIYLPLIQHCIGAGMDILGAEVFRIPSLHYSIKSEKWTTPAVPA